MTEIVLSMLQNTLTFSAPLILAALGGLTSERSGVINIGLEGKLLAAACATALVSQSTGNAAVGLLAGLVCGVLVSWLHFTLTQLFRIDQVISGMSINALAIGATSLVAKTFSKLASEKMAALPIAAYWIAAYTACVGVWWYLRSTKGGLRINAVGQDPDKSRQMGVSPGPVRFIALTWTGVFCGLGGAVIVTNAGSFSDGMTSGRGYIALAALILGGWRPLPSLAACVLVSFFDALRLQFQGAPFMGVTVPGEAWNALPYLVTLLAVAGLLGKFKAPAGLGKP